ncbi:MAG: trypsin-like peptidase domain-containing protein, partial [Pirellulaceae bacterium]
MPYLLRSILCFLVLIVFHAESEADDQVMEVLSATVKVSHSESTATAFFVSRETADGGELILVTAAHVLEKISDAECKLVLREKRLDGTYARRETKITIRNEGQPLWTQHPKADVAAIKLDLASIHSNVPINYERILNVTQSDDCGLQMGDRIWVLGFPAQLESGQSGFPVLRHGTVASFPLDKKTKTFMADYTTYVGDSGGPVFKRDLANSMPSTIVGLI